MKTFLTDQNNDLTLSPYGNLAILSGDPAIAQESRHHAATLRGEMIHRTGRGVPYFEFAFGAAPNLSQFEAALRQRILQTPGVEEIVDLQVTRTGDGIDYVATLRTENGNEVVANG